MSEAGSGDFSLTKLAQQHLTTGGGHRADASPTRASSSNETSTTSSDEQKAFFDVAGFGSDDAGGGVYRDFDAGIWSPTPRTLFACSPSFAVSNPILDLKTSRDELVEAACRDATKFGIIRLFVHNLSLGTRWQDLKDYFSRFGNVQYATIYSDPDTGGNLAYGFVVMSSVTETVAVLRCDKPHYLNGCRMVVELFRAGNGKYSNGFWTVLSHSDGVSCGFPRYRQNGENFTSNYRYAPSPPMSSIGGKRNRYVGVSSAKYSSNICDDFDFELGNEQYKSYIAAEKTGTWDALVKPAVAKPPDSFFDSFDTGSGAANTRPLFKLPNGMHQSQVSNTFQNRIMVSNMSLDTEWRDVKSFFEQFGPVKFVHMETGFDERGEKHLQLNSFSGYVEMVNEDDAVTLLNYEGTFYINNAAVQVRPYDGFVSSSGRCCD